MGQKTYVIGDTHGRFDLLSLCLAKIKEQTQDGNAPHTVVFLGDYIDRGPHSRNIIERLMHGPSKAAKWVPIQGNHEVLMINTIRYGKGQKMWLSNGGHQCLVSYGARNGMAVKEALTLVPDEHIQFLMSMPILHVDKHRVYVHAYIDRGVSLYEQRPNRVQWEDWPHGDEEDYHGLHIVHGHQPWPDGPRLYKGRSNFDTDSFMTGRQVIGIFDDDVPGGPIGFLEIK